MEQAYCDALRFAVDYERKGEEYYRQASEKAQDKLARKALVFLADEEKDHIRKIEDFNGSLLGLAAFDMDRECALSLPDRVREFIDDAKQQSKTEEEAELTDLAVYDLAMATEKQGFEMYASVRDSTGDQRLKRFFGFLADEEIVHHKLLAASKKYLEDQSYYFEEAGGWIFG